MNHVLWGVGLGLVLSLSTLGPRYLNPGTLPAQPNCTYAVGAGFIFLLLEYFARCTEPVAFFATGKQPVRARGEHTSRHACWGRTGGCLPLRMLGHHPETPPLPPACRHVDGEAAAHCHRVAAGRRLHGGEAGAGAGSHGGLLLCGGAGGRECAGRGARGHAACLSR